MNIVILNDTSNEFHHGCRRVMSNLILNLKKRGAKVSYIHKLGEEPNSPKLIKKLSICDIAIINGEGTIHSDKNYAYSLIRTVATNCNGKKYLINATYLNNGDRFIKYIKKFDGIYVRDQASFDELKSFGVKSNKVPDLSFYSPSIDGEKSGTYLVGCSVSRDITFRLYDKVRVLADFCPVSVFENRGLLSKIKLTRTSISKYEIMRPLKAYNYFRSRYWFEQTQYDDHYKLSEVIANSKGIISGRYHEICIALNNMTPILAIESNTKKISSLLNDIGLEERMMDINSQNVKSIRSYTKDEELKLISFLSAAKSNIKDMFDEICR